LRTWRALREIFDYQYLLYVHKGTGSIKIGNVTHIGTMGDIIFCPGGVSNTIIADEQEPFLLSGIEFNFNDIEKAKLFQNKMLPKLNLLHELFAIAAINKMIGEEAYRKIYAQQISDCLVSALITELLRISQIGSQNDENVVMQILNYVKENIQREVTYKELSELFSYHKSSINRLMKASTGMSLREYQIDLRIKTAKELLGFSKRPQAEIASLCGYNSAIFFSRQFKEKTGLTPCEYRNSRQNAF